MNTREILIEAKKSLTEEEDKKKEINVIKGKIATFDQKVVDLEKAKKDCIEKTVKEKKAELEKSYDDLMINTTQKIKHAREQKEKEIKKNKASQIETDTREKKDNIVYLKNRIKSVLKENKMPFYVNTNFYFSLFKYESAAGVIRAILIIAVLLVVIPGLFVSFVEPFKSTDNVFLKGLVFVVFVLIWGGIYMLLEKLSNANDDAIKEIKDLRKEIRENKKQINDITKRINEDTDETKFDYSKYDKEIEQASNDLKILGDKRIDALENFNNVVEKEIVESIEAEADKDIEEAKRNLEKAKNNLVTEEENYEKLKLKNIEEYESSLGKENMSVEKVNKLIDIVNNSMEEIDIETAKSMLLKK